MDEVPLYASRYPGYDVLAKGMEWDEVTRRVVEARVDDVPRLRFFSPEEAHVLEALAEVVVPQADRPAHLRIPLVPWLDERLHEGKGPGYRYEDVPPDPELWRRLVHALDAQAREGWGKRFLDLRPQERERLCEAIARGEARAGPWRDWPAARVWSLVVTEFVTHYYAHPHAWSEIGFGGPKFPRVYVRTARDDPGEAQEVWDG